MKKENKLILKYDIGDTSLLYVNENCKNIYKNIIFENKNNLLLNFHKYIDYYILEKKNIFSNNIKFSEVPMMKNKDIYMAIRTLYINDKITVELFLLNSLPHIMVNKEFYFNYHSLIKKYIKIFNINDEKNSHIFKTDLQNILYNIFDMTFIEMLNNF